MNARISNGWVALLVCALLSPLVGCTVDDEGEGEADAAFDIGLDGSEGPGGTSRGVPYDGYPSYQERLMLVAINRSRSDPNNPAAGTADECSEHRDPQPPVLFDFDAGQAARFHCVHLMVNGGGLSHATYCDLIEDLEASGCDGSAECSCVPGTECWSCETLGGCGTNYGGRLSRFGFTGSATSEVGAAGYSDGWSAVSGWMSENPCDGGTLAHRNSLTASQSNVVGTGYASGSGCWSAYYFADFGAIDGLEIPTVASAVHRPERGSASTTFSFYANTYSGTSDLTAVALALDGTCVEMEAELGDPGNRTYTASVVPAREGCLEYTIVAVDGIGGRTIFPARGSYLVEAGGDCAGREWTETRTSNTCGY